MVCSEELPAQWQGLPLRTRQEIQAGREAIGADEVRRVTISKWADEGDKWLREQFKNKPVAFHTGWDVAKGTITLEVYHVAKSKSGTEKFKLLFTEECRAENFVSEFVVTKILLITGGI